MSLAVNATRNTRRSLAELCFVNVHLMVEDLALTSLCLGDEGLVEDVKDILANLLELGLDLLTVFADDANVLVGSLGLLLLLDA